MGDKKVIEAKRMIWQKKRSQQAFTILIMTEK